MEPSAARSITRRSGPAPISGLLVVCSIAALVWMLAARMLGPSDASNQTQPKTTAYTTDILVNGRWVLPLERGELPATKPPMYNWLAVPMVKLLGFSSEIGHRFPSILAMCACWLIVVRVGGAIDRGDGSLGWLAGMIVPTSYTLFKLGYLARPDMLLTMWLLLGWCAATRVLVGEVRESSGFGEGGALAVRPPAEPGAKGAGFALLAFWICVGLAGLTKGPASFVLLVYALVAARAIGGSWRTARVFGWWWGLPLSLIMVGWWIAAAWMIDPVHVREVMWKAEIWGRVTGLGPEGNHDGPAGWLRDFFNQGLFYFARFAPWSVFSVLAAARLWRTGGWRSVEDVKGAWLHGAAIFVVVVIGLFTLSAGKRADYIAAAFPPGALLAAWWLRDWARARRWNALWPAAALTAITLSIMSIANQMQFNAPSSDFDRSIMDFVRKAQEAIKSEPQPVVFYWTGTSHLKAYLGYSEPDSIKLDRLRELASGGKTFWIVAGRESQPPMQFDEAVAKHVPELELRVVVRSPLVPQARGWPTQMTLYEAVKKSRSPRTAHRNDSSAEWRGRGKCRSALRLRAGE